MKNKNAADAFTSFLSAIGITASTADLQNVLNIILLILSIANIMLVLGLRVYEAIKNKRYEEIPQHVNDAIDDVNEVKGKIKGGE